ncbi:MAG TPA: hypothetical protein VGN36_01590 [Sphingorhabdus sp.]|nr:hypothetical protein [Sphingorhabdus sp.]
MSARFACAQGGSAKAAERIVMCPNCGSDDFKSNLIDEKPFREAARGAKLLRRLGHLGAAGDVLTRLASVRIINFLRHRYECNACGAQFDE